MPTFLLPLIAVMLVLLSDATAARGQTRANRVPATVALSDVAPKGARFLVKRFPGAAGGDVIVLPPDASAADLSAAVRTLLTVRERDGDTPRANRTVRLRPGSAASLTRASYPWAARVLADVSRSNRTTVPGIGRVRAVQIWLPGQGQRERARPVVPQS